MSTQGSQTFPFIPELSSRVQVGAETCPACGQEIPPDKFEEISGRIAAREREQVLAVTARHSTRLRKRRPKVRQRPTWKLSANTAPHARPVRAKRPKKLPRICSTRNWRRLSGSAKSRWLAWSNRSPRQNRHENPPNS